MMLLAHGNNLDELAAAAILLLAVAAIGLVAWIGSRRQRRRGGHDRERPGPPSLNT